MRGIFAALMLLGAVTGFPESFRISDHAGPLTVAYPQNEAVFPPEMAAPTFVWSDPAENADTWLIDAVGGDGDAHVRALTRGDTPPPARDGDPRTASAAGSAYKPIESPATARRWRPSPEVWEQIKSLSKGRTMTVTITGFTITDGNS